MSEEPQHTTTNATRRRSTWQANIRLTQWLRLALILTVVPVPLFVLRLFGLVPLHATAFLSCLYGLLVVLLLGISWVVDRCLPTGPYENAVCGTRAPLPRASAVGSRARQLLLRVAVASCSSAGWCC